MSYANNAPIGAITAPRRRLRRSAGALAVTVVDSDWPTRAHPTGGGGHALNQGPKTVEGLNGKKLVPGS